MVFQLNLGDYLSGRDLVQIGFQRREACLQVIVVGQIEVEVLVFLPVVVLVVLVPLVVAVVSVPVVSPVVEVPVVVLVVLVFAVVVQVFVFVKVPVVLVSVVELSVVSLQRKVYLSLLVAVIWMECF